MDSSPGVAAERSVLLPQLPHRAATSNRKESVFIIVVCVFRLAFETSALAAVRGPAELFLKRGMPMKTGLLNKRIEILGKQAVTDEYGFDTQADVVVYRCWASIEPARGKVFYEMERKADTEYSKITIRWRPGVTHDMKVKYQDHLYDIDTIVDPYMRHEALELYCTEEVRGTDNERK